jgi:hypothetical protein
MKFKLAQILSPLIKTGVAAKVELPEVVLQIYSNCINVQIVNIMSLVRKLGA